MSSTSLLDTIQECTREQITTNDLIQLPFIEEIASNKFNIHDKTIDQLINSLITHSYLNIDSKQLIDEILWQLGGNENEFNKWFVKVTRGGKYSFKENVNLVIKNEITNYLNNLGIKPPYLPEALNLRFQNILTIGCVKANNLRLLDWAGKNCKLVTKSFNQHHVDRICEIAKQNAKQYGNQGIIDWLENNGFDSY